jgi:hypothetical protein
MNHSSSPYCGFSITITRKMIQCDFHDSSAAAWLHIIFFKNRLTNDLARRFMVNLDCMDWAVTR